MAPGTTAVEGPAKRAKAGKLNTTHVAKVPGSKRLVGLGSPLGCGRSAAAFFVAEQQCCGSKWSWCAKIVIHIIA